MNRWPMRWETLAYCFTKTQTHTHINTHTHTYTHIYAQCFIQDQRQCRLHFMFWRCPDCMRCVTVISVGRSLSVLWAEFRVQHRPTGGQYFKYVQTQSRRKPRVTH